MKLELHKKYLEFKNEVPLIGLSAYGFENLEKYITKDANLPTIGEVMPKDLDPEVFYDIYMNILKFAENEKDFTSDT